MDSTIYLVIGEEVWVLTDDGSMSLLPAGQSIPDGAVVLGEADLNPEQIKDIEARKAQQIEGRDSQGQDSLAPSPTNVSSLKLNKSSANTLPNSGSLAQQFSDIDRDNSETLAEAGFQTHGFDTEKLAPEPDQHELIGKIDPNASITVQIQDGGDEWINRFEITHVDISGTTVKAGFDRTVDLLVTDSQGRSLAFTTPLLDDGSYLLEQADISQLAEGPITVIASITDPYDNRIDSEDTSVIDTLAEGDSVEVDNGGDPWVDLVESRAAPFSGHFSDVQAGALVELVVTDVNGGQLSFETLLNADGTWALAADISTMADGEIQFTASTIDQAGNPAEVSGEALLQISPLILVQSTDNDHIYNEYEAPSPLFRGLSLNIEDGQSVTLTVTDANGTQVEAIGIVESGRWQVDGPDISGLVDGPITVTARSTNLEGLEASNSIEEAIDQTAEITAQVDDNDAILNANEATAMQVSGSTVDINDGNSVNITVTDSLGVSLNFFRTAEVESDAWLASGLDVSSLAAGELTLRVSSRDNPGNDADVVTTVMYDPIAEIDSIVASEGPVYNAAEVAGFTLTGTTVDIDAGQILDIVVTDENGDSVSGTATVQNDGTWAFSSSIDRLADGELEVDVSGYDAPGNFAENSISLTKDTRAVITLEFDGDQDYSVFEYDAVSLSGLVFGVEDGQSIDLIVRDSANPANEISVMVLVDGGRWQSEALDLQAAGFIDGQLSAEVSTVDLAGNPAGASTTAQLDTQVTIDIAPDAINIDDIRSLSALTIGGSSTNSEAGTRVTLSFSDGSNTEQFSGLVQSDGSWSVDVQLSGSLSDAVAWQLDAQIQDEAGNIANDATPSLVLPSAVTLSEQIVFDTSGTDSASASINISDADEFNLSANQSALSTLTSMGFALTVTVAGDAQSLQVTRNDGSDTLVLDAAINGGNVDLRLYQGLDQAVGEDSLVAQLWLDATQDDADGTSETVTAPVNITITDVAPNLVDDSDEITEGYSVSGNVLTNDTSLEGPLTLVSIEAEGNVITISAGTPAVYDYAEGRLTVNQDGSWQFDANPDLDHSGALPQVVALYNAQDHDGDVRSADLTIDILDAPTITIVSADNDHIYNEYEAPSASFSGVTTNIENGRDVDLVWRDVNGDEVTITTTVSNNAWSVSNINLSGLADGPLTIEATSSNTRGIVANASLVEAIDQTAEITAVFDDADNILNATEALAALAEGTTVDVDDNSAVSLVIEDSLGATVEVPSAALVAADLWSASGLNLAGLEPGTLTLTATVSDSPGNDASVSTTIEYDPIAEIDITDPAAGPVYNAAEVAGFTLDGTTIDIDQNQVLDVVITDINGDTVEGTATVQADGTWNFANSIAGLADGELSVDVSGYDAPGNFAEDDISLTKDTLAEITVVFDGDKDYSASEATAVTLSGTVTGVEVGQEVTVLISDSDSPANELSVTATVQAGGIWQTDAQDLVAAGFIDGALSAVASVSDQAGNPASASDTAALDTELMIDIDPDAIDITDFILLRPTVITGTTSAEDDQELSLTISDGANSHTFTADVAGGAWSVNVGVLSGLNRSVPWTLTASVNDVAGNEATDSTPTIAMPDSIRLFELGIILPDVLATATSDLNITEADEYAISSVQADLELLTSNGHAITVMVAADGQSLTATRSGDSAVVFTAELNADASLTVTLHEGVDQAAGEDSLETSIWIDATQNDADATSETLTAPVNITISDVHPFLFNDRAEVDEALTVTGNVFDNDSSLEGPLTLTSITVNGTDIAVTPTTPAIHSFPEGELTVNYDGTWSFVANEDLDNSVADPEVLISYTAVDPDGDMDTADLRITIHDGAGGTLDDSERTYTELDLSELDSDITRVLNVTAGTDALDPGSVEFDNTDNALIDRLNAMGITSDGEAVTFAMGTSDAQIIASTVSHTIFTATLSAVSNGRDLDMSVRVQVERPLDHLSGDEIVFDADVLAHDIDTGTPTNNAVLELRFDDGQDPSMDLVPAVALEETALAASPSTMSSGTVNLEVGSDPIASLAFVETVYPSLSSGGVELATYVSTAADSQTLLYYFVNQSDPNDRSNKVLEVTLDTNINAELDTAANYTVELFQAVDQLENGVNDGDIELLLPVVATDVDGDTSNIDLEVTINDGDAPNLDGASLEVTELPAKDGNSLSNEARTDLTISAAEDRIVAIGYDLATGTTVQDANGDDITKNGGQLIWRDNFDGTLDAVDSNNVSIFTLHLPDSLDIDPGTGGTAELRFVLHSAIDHRSSDALVLNVPVQVTDSDGTTGSANVDITIDDGRDPQIDVLDDVAVDELVLQSNDHDSDKGSAYGDGHSDDILAVVPTMNTAVSSGGEAVTLANSPNSNGWWIARTSGGDEVFRLFFNTTDNEYTVRFSRAIDHDDANGRNDKEIDFSIDITDADGDSSNSDFTLTVTDDVPVAQAIIRDVDEGKTVSGSLLPGTAGGSDGAEITQMSYEGTDFSPNGSGQFVIALFDDMSQAYGTLTVEQDGSYVLQAGSAFELSDVHTDVITYVTRDFDGDVESSNTFTINVHDADGNIILPDLDTQEDTHLDISDLVVNPGDLDQNETVTSITFDLAALAGGTLTLNGIALAVDGDGNPFLSQAQLRVLPAGANPGSVEPDGTLLYIPALNQSQATTSPALDVTATISTDIGDVSINELGAITVVSVADTPVWDDGASVYSYEFKEDDGGVDLDLEAALYDVDGSENLSFRISNISTGLVLTHSGQAVSEGAVLSAAQVAQLHASTVANFAGTASFDISAIATEGDNHDTAEDSRTVNFDVSPVADDPSLIVTPNYRSLEDVDIDLSRLVSGSLSDNDGSETLSFEFIVPTGWSVVGLNGAIVTGSGTSYEAQAADLDAGNVVLRPLEDISSYTNGGPFTITVTAISHESTQDGVAPDAGDESQRSASKDIKIDVKGVIDEPDIGPGPDGYWSYDDGSMIISSVAAFDEDELIKLNFSVATQDDDASEQINMLLTGVPEGAEIVGASGESLDLAIFGFNGDEPIYQIKASDLATYQLRPPADFSGQITLNLSQVNTEPDGASGTFPMTLVIDVAPIVDSNDGLNTSSSGAEDIAVVLNLTPSLSDVDGSEEVTELVLNVSQGSLLLDGVDIGSGSITLSTLVDGTSPTVADLISSNRLTWQPPLDASGDFALPVTWTITDTSETNVSVSKDVTGNVNVNVDAQVDPDNALDNNTRIETTGPLVSTDGSAISLDGAAQFVDDDIDGSEYVYSLQINMPEATGWFLSHPNGAVHDGRGNWLIPATGLTSDSVQEAAAELLQGAEIISDHVVANAEVLVSIRVLDDNDAEMRTATLDISFDVATGGTASDPDDLQVNTIPGQEGTAISLGAYLDNDIAGDGNDVISFRIDAADMPEGGSVSGPDVIAHYAANGTSVISYVFTQASVDSLVISNINEDFAGIMDIPITVVATDPSGATFTEVQNLHFEIAPVVDDMSSPAGFSSKEDEVTRFDFDINSLLGDPDVDSSRGVEEVIELRFTIPAQGTINDPEGVLTIDGGEYVLGDLTKLNTLSYTPPLNLSGDLSLAFRAHIRDTTVTLPDTGQSNVDEQWRSGNINFELEPVTDHAILSAVDITGNEDSQIALTGLDAELYDTDGSEYMSLQITGVPQGAVIYYNGSTQLPNNGEDGGTFMGQPTYAFAVQADQLDNLVIVPPLDFSGDFELSLSAVTVERETNEHLLTTQGFTVHVLPVADTPQMANDLDELDASEGDVVNIAINASTTETVNANEVLILTVEVVSASSDASALDGLKGIKVGDHSVDFVVDVGTGNLVAVFESDSDSLASFDLLTGPTAFGDLQMNVAVQAKDEAVVDGSLATDTSDIADAQEAITLHLSPLPDAPLLSQSYDQLVIDGDSSAGEHSLDLSVQLQNPAPGEEAFVKIEGLPDHASFVGQSPQGSIWTIAAADVASLEVTGLQANDNFVLSLTPYSELDGQTDTGTVASLQVVVGAAGDSTIMGSGGEDRFVFDLVGAGPAGTPASDHIAAFDASRDGSDISTDSIDLSDLLQGVASSTGAELDVVMDFSDDGTDTTLVIDLGGGDVQNIVIEGQTVDELYGGSTSGIDDDDILQKLITDQLLITV